MSTWKHVNYNQVLNGGDDFFVSYNPDTTRSHVSELLTELANGLGGDVRDGEETALVKRNPNGIHTYSILSGDWRKEYEQLIDKGYEACYEFFKSQQGEFGNNWSTRQEDRR